MKFISIILETNKIKNIYFTCIINILLCYFIHEFYKIQYIIIIFVNIFNKIQVNYKVIKLYIQLI